MNDVITLFFGSLLPQLPQIAAYLAAVIVAAVFWSRCPRSSLLTLLAALVLLFTTLIQAYVWASLFFWRESYRWSAVQYGQMSTVVSVAGGIFRAIGMGLLIWAVFAGRGRERYPASALNPPPPVPPPGAPPSYR